MAYKDETEADTRANRVDTALKDAGWGSSQIKREEICPGRIEAGGRRGASLSCDYVLSHKGQKLATIEAKRAGLGYTAGLTQTKEYAQRLKTPFAYCTNGLKWYEVDMRTATEGDMSLPFPTPDELYARAFDGNPNDWRDKFGEVPFEEAGGKWEARYYQHNAINAVLEAIGKGRDRILLTLATGTGKTSIAFQIAWKLFQARWNRDQNRDLERQPRTLFLTDRNILADQAFNAFSAFPADALTRITAESIRKNGQKVPKNASVFFTLFQTLMAGEEPVYKQYSPDFFDFIVIDECHRGGANDEGEWRAILKYFAPAVQLGMTATPKRKDNVDTYEYFGEPVYVYSLRDGIEDGFLTPFKVRQIKSNMDDYWYDRNDIVLLGEIDESKTYTEKEINRWIVIAERERSRVREYLSEVNQEEKAIVFCANQAHAAMIRDLINQETSSGEVDYCHRVTSDEGELGEQHLRDFQDNARDIPTILTTSQKLSTGVDARNIRHIVLLRPINSMIEFKQIIGRGTRVYTGKDFFTIWDFVKAHKLFNDPAWDGEPIDPPKTEKVDEPDSDPYGPDGPDKPDPDAPERIVVQLSDERTRSIWYSKTTTYWDPSGKPVSAEEFIRLIFGHLTGMAPDEAALRKIWKDPDTRKDFLKRLEEDGFGAARLEDLRGLVAGADTDIFDVLNYVLYEVPPRPRSLRASPVTARGLNDQNDAMKRFLARVLGAYVKNGEKELGTDNLIWFIKAAYGTTADAQKELGDMPTIRSAYLEMQERLYAA